jgi:hypothetical protein
VQKIPSRIDGSQSPNQDHMSSDDSEPVQPPNILSSIQNWIAIVKDTWIIDPNESIAPLSSHQMDEYEVPTAPPSPKLAPKPPHLPPRRAKDLLEPIEADQQKCAICCLDCSSLVPQYRVEHMNKCWDPLRRRAQENIALKKKLLELIQDKQDASGDDKQEDQDFSSTSSSSSDSDSTSSSSSDLPPSTTAVALQIPTSSCLICATPLIHLDSIAAFNHRVYCITNHRPYFCPICSTNFLYPLVWDRPDIAWHLHNCQHGGKLTVPDRVDFGALTDAWNGRMAVVERVIFRTGGGGEAAGTYRRKKEQGVWRGDGVYWVGETGLRMARVVKGVEVEVTTAWEACTPDSVDVEKFRRRAFPVLGVPRGSQIPEGWKLVGKTVEVEVLETTTVRGDDGQESYDAGIDEFAEIESRDECMAETVDVDSHDEVKADSTSTEPLIRPPPGFSHPTTTMEMLDAVLDIVRSRAEAGDYDTAMSEEFDQITDEDEAIWRDEMF